MLINTLVIQFIFYTIFAKKASVKMHIFQADGM